MKDAIIRVLIGTAILIGVGWLIYLLISFIEMEWQPIRVISGKAIRLFIVVYVLIVMVYGLAQKERK